MLVFLQLHNTVRSARNGPVRRCKIQSLILSLILSLKSTKGCSTLIEIDIEIDKGSSTMSISMSISMIESMIDSCTGRSTLHEIMSRSRICARIYARINDRINQAVWFYDRFLHRRTGCIGNGRARSVSISISMIESCSGTSTARSAARFKINDWFYHWNRHRRTCYVEIAVLVPLSISMIESIIDSIIEIDIVEQGLSISMIDSCIVEQHLNYVDEEKLV